MIKALSAFIPVTGNTHDLQNRRTATGSWFMQTVAKVNPRVDSGQTSQGFYVVAPDGTAYGFNNNRSVDRVLSFMADGLRSFREAPRPATEVPMLGSPRLQAPEGASVLRIYSRITPTPEGCNESNKNLQRDHFWVMPAEVSALAGGVVLESLQLRLCRFALVDAVRGEPDFWALASIQKREFSVDGNRIMGSFQMRSARQTLDGAFEAEFSVNNGRLATFKGYAECTASGSGQWTPGAPEGKFPLKFAFVVAPATSDTVSPQAAMFGREYLTGR